MTTKATRFPFVIFALLLGVFLLLPTSALAQNISEDFDGYANGLNFRTSTPANWSYSNSGWLDGTTITVDNSLSVSSPNSLFFDVSGTNFPFLIYDVPTASTTAEMVVSVDMYITAFNGSGCTVGDANMQSVVGFSTGSGKNDFMLHACRNGQLMYQISTGLGTTVPGTPTLSPNTWYNLAVGREFVNSSLIVYYIYVDGVLIYTYNQTTSFNNTPSLTELSPPVLRSISASTPASVDWYADNFAVEFGSIAPPTPIGTSRIITVTPPDDLDGSSARATSTTFAFEATGYINEANYVDGMRLIIRARNNVAAASNAVGPLFSEGGNALCSWLPDWLCPPLPGEEETYTFSGAGSYEFEFPITAAGDFSVATTTDVQVIGRYTMFTTVEQPNETFLGLTESYSQFLSTTTQFTVATSSSYDRAIGSTVEAIVASQTAIDPTCSFDFFTPSNYLPAIQTCITSLFAVPSAYVADGLMGAMSDLLSHAPWGYATRVYVILTEETASSTLPSLAVDIPDGLPMGGTALPDFAPWDGIEVAVAQLDVADVETMEGSPLENFEFWWNFMWSLMFAFWVIREIYGMAEMGDFEDLTERMGMAGGRAHGRIRKASNGQRYQEYTNADVKRAMRRGSRKGVIH